MIKRMCVCVERDEPFAIEFFLSVIEMNIVYPPFEVFSTHPPFVVFTYSGGREVLMYAVWRMG